MTDDYFPDISHDEMPFFLWFGNCCAGNVIENKLPLLPSAKPKRNTKSEEYTAFHLNAGLATSVSKLEATCWC